MNLVYLLMLALLNSCIELEISAPSFPDISDYFNVPDSVMGMTITLNLVGFCIGAMIYGPLSDAYGRRKIMLIGNGILTIGALGCVIAWSMKILLLARFIQGVGAATSAVVVSAIIADKFPLNKAQKIYGHMNAFFSTAMALSPLLGGLLNYYIGWRGNYGFVASICIISWVLLLLNLPETNSRSHNIRLKKLLKIYKTLLTKGEFLALAAIPSLLYGCYLTFVGLSPFVYMETLNLTMLEYTLNMAFIVGSFAITSFFAGKFTPNSAVKIGKICALCGSVIICLDGITLGMAIFSIGFALIYPVIFARSMEIFPDIKGVASSVIMGLRYLLCACLTGVASLVFDGSILSLGMVIIVVSGSVIGLLFMQNGRGRGT